jgi:hypothetical protein
MADLFACSFEPSPCSNFDAEQSEALAGHPGALCLREVEATKAKLADDGYIQSHEN